MKKIFFGLYIMILVLSSMPHRAFGENYALFFATTEFERAKSLPPLENDAKGLRNAMMQQGVVSGRNSRFMTGKNRKAIMKKTIIDAGKKMTEGDTFIIYNTGHGSKDGKLVVGDGYISSDELSGWLSEAGCSNILFINQSCYSGKFKLSVPGKKVCQMSSSNQTKKSWVSPLKSQTTGQRHGMYTKYLIDAMDPRQSDKNGDGVVTALEMQQYVNRQLVTSEYIEWMKNWAESNPYYEMSAEGLEEREQALKKRLKIATEIEDRLWKLGYYGPLGYRLRVGEEKLKKLLSRKELEIFRRRKYYREHLDYVKQAQEDWFRKLVDGEAAFRDHLPVLYGDPNFVVSGRKKTEQETTEPGHEQFFGTKWKGRFYSVTNKKNPWFDFSITFDETGESLVGIMSYKGKTSLRSYTARVYRIEYDESSGNFSYLTRVRSSSNPKRWTGRFVNKSRTVFKGRYHSIGGNRHGTFTMKLVSGTTRGKQ